MVLSSLVLARLTKSILLPAVYLGVGITAISQRAFADYFAGKPSDASSSTSDYLAYGRWSASPSLKIDDFKRRFTISEIIKK